MSDRASEGRHHGTGESESPREARRVPPSEGAVPTCDLCGAPMIDRHCKLACPTCGYQRDCSDP